MCCDVIAILTGALPGTSGSSLKPSVGGWPALSLSPRSPGPKGTGGPRSRAQRERHSAHLQLGARPGSAWEHISGSPGSSVLTPSFLVTERFLYTKPKERRSPFGVILPQEDIGQYMGTFLVVTTGEVVLLARGG